MKRCPTCSRTFLDEQLSFCTDDGTPLVNQAQSSSYDPQATMVSPTPPVTNEIRDPPQTRPFRPNDTPGAWPQPHGWSQPSSQPVSQQPSWNSPSSQPGAWTPPPPPGGQFAVKKPQHNPVAIASLAVGVFSLTIGLCCYLGAGTGPIAIVLGAVALTQVKNSPTQAVSKGMAIAGIATGAAAMGLIMLFFFLGIAFGNWR